jgi:hypothetical protein
MKNGAELLLRRSRPRNLTDNLATVCYPLSGLRVTMQFRRLVNIFEMVPPVQRLPNLVQTLI